MSSVRQIYEGTLEAGEVHFARLDLGDVHMWIYPEDTPGKVRVEIEEKSALEMISKP